LVFMNRLDFSRAGFYRLMFHSFLSASTKLQAVYHASRSKKRKKGRPVFLSRNISLGSENNLTDHFYMVANTPFT
ncbi:MAG: hypothetical protein PHY02_10890, partial [Phycisphaerae bacterium]|nr:hypothetical protein [Phycisphaerae bacterium]